MAASPAFGFITVADLGESALIGGYLLLNRLGRPLEFHCTEPTRPSRAQQILFGPTLRSYLCGELIAQTLLNHASLQPELVVTNCEAVLAVQEFIEIPVVWALPEESADRGPTYRVAQWGRNCVAVPAGRAEDLQRAAEIFRRRIPEWDLQEPFLRIGEAVEELQKAA